MTNYIFPNYMAKAMTKKRIAWNKGISTGPLSEEHKNKIRKTLTGAHRSEEVKNEVILNV